MLRLSVVGDIYPICCCSMSSPCMLLCTMAFPFIVALHRCNLLGCNKYIDCLLFGTKSFAAVRCARHVHCCYTATQQIENGKKKTTTKNWKQLPIKVTASSTVPCIATRRWKCRFSLCAPICNGNATTTITPTTTTTVHQGQNHLSRYNISVGQNAICRRVISFYIQKKCRYIGLQWFCLVLQTKRCVHLIFGVFLIFYLSLCRCHFFCFLPQNTFVTLVTHTMTIFTQLLCVFAEKTIP